MRDIHVLKELIWSRQISGCQDIYDLYTEGIVKILIDGIVPLVEDEEDQFLTDVVNEVNPYLFISASWWEYPQKQGKAKDNKLTKMIFLT